MNSYERYHRLKDKPFHTLSEDDQIFMMGNEHLEEVYKSSRHRAEVRSKLKNSIFHPSQQDKLLDYLVSLELKVEALEDRLDRLQVWNRLTEGEVTDRRR